MLVGYARISTDGQTLDPQLDQLRTAGCDKIFSDIASGSKTDRKGLYKAFNFARKGDTLVVVKLDRMGRSLKDLIEKTTDLATRGIELKSLNESIDTSTPAGKLLFVLMAALAEFERDIIRERTKAGLASARARGRTGGRPSADSKKLKAALALYDAQGMTLSAIQETTGISKSTLYREINRRKAIKT